MGEYEASIVWRGIVRPGHEHARAERLDSGWRLDGVAVFVDASRACRLEYAIGCDAEWRTQHAAVTGWVGDNRIDLNIDATADGVWRINGDVCACVHECIDIDLNFSPVTNLLPIRRLRPQVGETIRARAAWLRFPSFALEPLEQTYHRVSEVTYTYTSGGGAFTAEIVVNDFGLAVSYGGGWVRE